MRRRVVALELASSILCSASLTLILGFMLVAAEAALYLGPEWRTGLGMGVIVGSLLCFGIVTRRRLAGRISLRSTALYTEGRCPQLQQRLISTLELQGERSERYSAELLAATAAAAARLLDRIEPRSVVELRSLWRAVRQLGTTLAAAILCGLLWDDLSAAAVRCANPSTTYAREARTRIGVSPGDLEIVKGDDAVVHIHFSGRVPHTAEVLRREAEEAPWQKQEILVDKVADSLAYVFDAVERPFQYRVRGGDGISDIYGVIVIEPPAVQRLRLHYVYPGYSRIPPRVDEEAGDIRGLAGTEVGVQIVATKPLSAAALVLSPDSLRIPAVVSDDRAAATVELAFPSTTVRSVADSLSTAIGNGRYYVELTDRKGVGNRDPIRYAVRVLDDALPRVAITEPGEDGDLPEKQQLMLTVEVGDDFGISALDLVYRVDGRAEQRRALPLDEAVAVADGDAARLTLSHLWDLSAAGLLPEDRIRYRVEAFDNDTVSGPKMSASTGYVLRMPSLYELFREVAEEQQDHIAALEELGEEERSAQRQLEQVRRELMRTEELNWQQKRELESALEEQRERAEAVDELAQQIAETVDKLEDHGLSSESVLDKLQEIRELMADVTSPQIREALRDLNQGMEELDPAQLAAALKEFAEDSELFHQRLDRTLALLRRIHAEQRLEAAVRQAADLKTRQEQIDAALAGQRQEQSAALTSQQQSSARDAERLLQELENLSGDLEEISPPTAEGLAAEAAAMEQKNLSGRMEEMVGELKASRPAEAQRIGAGLEEDLGVLSSGLESVRADFVAEQKRQLAAELRKAMADVLGLSHRQEEIAGRTREAGAALPAGYAHEQFALLRGTGMAIERIASISGRTMATSHGLPAALGSAMQTMEQAAHHLGQRHAVAAAKRQVEAMGYLNEAVLLLRQSADNLARAAMPSGFAEAMQKMLGLSEQQAALNKATQQMLADGSGMGQRGGRAADLREQMKRLISEQRRIYNALAELERELRGNRGARKRVEAIRKEMKKLLAHMQRSRPDAGLQQSQERILQRMLDASRSIYARGFQRRRRSETGLDQTFDGPQRLPADLGQTRDYLREAMKRALAGDYPPAYVDLIRRYYELVYGDAVGDITPGVLKDEVDELP